MKHDATAGHTNEPADGAPLLLRPREAAQILAISSRKLWELTNTGEVPCVRIGRCLRYPMADLREWVAEKRRQRA